jgi:energy-converting hydrogenase Eha subunit A
VLWLSLFAFALLILGAEELSWGQRLFNIETPQSIANSNFQGEFNLHNSKWIQSHNNAFSVYLTKLLVMYLIIVPIFLRAFPTLHRFVKKFSLPTPTLAIALTTLIAKLINNQTYKSIYGSTEVADILSLGETYESILELSLCWVAWNYMGYIRQKKSITAELKSH